MAYFTRGSEFALDEPIFKEIKNNYIVKNGLAYWEIALLRFIYT